MVTPLIRVVSGSESWPVTGCWFSLSLFTKIQLPPATFRHSLTLLWHFSLDAAYPLPLIAS